MLLPEGCNVFGIFSYLITKDMQKSVLKIFPPPEPHFVGDGFRVHNFIPAYPELGMQRMDPFIMLDYNSNHYFPPAEKPRGVGVHPHRGFETVTIAYKGSIAHHDSHGGHGIIREGDVQWMTAASGVLHKEYHEEQFSKAGGHFHMVQLWVNLPAKNKMHAPKYQALSHAEIPRYFLPEDQGEIEVIAGRYQNTSGAAETFSPMHVMNSKLKDGAYCSFSFPANYNTGLLMIEGEILLNGASVPQDHFALMSDQGETFSIESRGNSTALILSGKPLGEPIAAHGPFVMNTREELIRAFEDFQSGQFGHLT